MIVRSTMFKLASRVTVAVLTMALQCVVAAPMVDGTAHIKNLMGTYLGRAIVKDLDTNQTEEREIDVEISPFKGDGFRIRWVNVTLVEGRRDLPGVKRRLSEVAFTPAKDQNFFVEVAESSVFGEREEVTPLGGDPVRWAVLDAAGLHLYAFVVLNDGRYELQTYSRRRTTRGIDLYYERVVDGKRVRTIEGRAAKVE